MRNKSARRWLARNAWKIIKYKLDIGGFSLGSCMFVQYIKCLKAAGRDIRFLEFKNVL